MYGMSACRVWANLHPACQIVNVLQVPLLPHRKIASPPLLTFDGFYRLWQWLAGMALPIGENLTRITKGIYPVSYLSALGLCVGRYAMRGKLCLKDRELQKSRVIPGFFFKPPYLLARFINTFLRG